MYFARRLYIVTRKRAICIGLIELWDRGAWRSVSRAFGNSIKELHKFSRNSLHYIGSDRPKSMA